jgi:predicted O-methyltransferase YrrM
MSQTEPSLYVDSPTGRAGTATTLAGMRDSPRAFATEIAQFVVRVRRRYREAHEQAARLRLPYFVAPLHRRSSLLLRRRLRALGVRESALYLRELEADGIHERVEAVEAEYFALLPQDAPGSIYGVEGALLYALVRRLRPATIVETGTASGISTTYLLAALARNDTGRLVSIDLPFELGTGKELLRPLVPGTSIEPENSSPLPPGKDPGWAIPDELRERWELRVGDARELLPTLLDEVGEIGLFLHDSLHTRAHMLFEFESAWPHLARGGVLAADDVFQRKHDALPAFARSVGRRFTTFSNLGFVRK